jgi:uncharacterized membrane protein
MRSGRLAPVFVTQTFYLSLSSGFACCLLAVRYRFSGVITYSFLLWNLFLAWLPFLLSMLASGANRRRRWGWLLITGILWLLFFPNAPYILTDFLHLAHRAPIPIWYDLLLLAAFSWTGISLALYSLSAMHAIIREHGGAILGWLFAAAAVMLSGMGVYLGRFLRWNSWDVFSQPVAILVDFGIRLANPRGHIQTYAVTTLFAAFMFICYLPVAHRSRMVVPSS